MMNISKSFHRLIASLMCLILAISAPLQAYASSGSKKYISDLKIAYGKTPEEAQKFLETEGYQLVDRDFNADNDDLLSKKRAVYLGYKVTSDPKEAITDLKLMNMKGNYSFEDYQKVLQKEKDDINSFLEDFNLTLKEYRKNYENQTSKAIIAHDALNLLYDDDTEKYMGDLLLKETVQEMGADAYAALTDEEKKEHADMVTILMQANSDAVVAIEQNLYLGADPDQNATFLDRLRAIRCYDDFEAAYMSKLPASTSINTVMKKMTIAYGDTAAILADKIQNLREYMELYTKHELFGEENEDVIEAYFDDKPELDDIYWNNAKNLYDACNDITYEDDNLYDFITNEEYDFEGEDQYLLYPMASTLSEGQVACLPFVSLVQMFNVAITGQKGCKNVYDNWKINLHQEKMKASIYEGVDRSIFNMSSVAMTSVAKEHMNSSEASYLYQWFHLPLSNLTSVMLILSCTSAVISAGFKGASLYYLKKYREPHKIPLEIYTNEEPVPIYNLAGQRINNEDLLERTDSYSDIASQSGLMGNNVQKAEEASFQHRDYDSSPLDNSKMARYLSIAFCVGALLMATASLYSVYVDLQKYYHQQRTPIPQYMIDSATGDGKIKNFIFYTAVICNRQQGGFDTADIAEDPSILGDYGDLKGDVGREWLALYYTKNSEAGNPITTDILLQEESSDLKAGYNVLSMFGSKSMANLNDREICYGNPKALYMMFKNDTKTSLTGSIFAAENMVYLAGLAIILGLTYAIIVRRKKEE